MQKIDLSQDIQSLSDFRSGISTSIQQVTETKRPLVITQHGKGVAVLADVSEFEMMQKRLELLEALYKAESQIDEGHGVDHATAKEMILKGIKR